MLKLNRTQKNDSQGLIADGFYSTLIFKTIGKPIFLESAAALSGLDKTDLGILIPFFFSIFFD